MQIQIYQLTKLHNLIYKDLVFETSDVVSGHKRAQCYLNNFLQSEKHYHEIYLDGKKVNLRTLENKALVEVDFLKYLLNKNKFVRDKILIDELREKRNKQQYESKKIRMKRENRINKLQKNHKQRREEIREHLYIKKLCERSQKDV